MSHIITAIYEQGILRPLEPLVLTEHSQVRLQILETTSSPNEVDEVRRAEAVLIAAGLIQPLNIPADLPHIPVERRTELAQLYATGGPLSEVVIAEREGR